MTGGSGQVGGAVVELLREQMPQVTVVVPSREEMDLARPESVREYVRRMQPRWIVSSGAYTAVDAAETDRDTAWAANAISPGVMAEEAAALGSLLIHLSTDYVFPGTGERPWVETDATGPLNVYGESKLAGEQAIAAAGAAHVILRTSWVYADTGKNFVRTMLRLLTTKDTPLRVVADQHGAPTAARDLAEAILSVLQKTSPGQEEAGKASQENVYGVYHCVAQGETTWAGLAMAIRDYLAENGAVSLPEIIPVPSSEYPTPAARPKNSRLNCDKLQATFGITLSPWNVSLRTILERLTATADTVRGFNP